MHLPLLVLALVLELSLLPSPPLLVTALTLPELRHRSVYQVLTDRFALAPSASVDPASASAPETLAPCRPDERRYCGGTWAGLTARLGYIQALGFDTVWISPVVANVPTPEAYHGYWAGDLFRLNSAFGTGRDLRELADALHQRGMWLMVDVVANHLGSAGGVDEWRRGVKEGRYGPFDREEDFHPYCTPKDWEDQAQIEQCKSESESES